MWGARVYLWSIHDDVWQKPSHYCNYPTIKANNKENKYCRKNRRVILQLKSGIKKFTRRRLLDSYDCRNKSNWVAENNRNLFAHSSGVQMSEMSSLGSRQDVSRTTFPQRH